MTEEPTFKTVIATIGDMIASNSQLRVYCESRGCEEGRQGQWVDLQALADRLGEDHGCMHDDLKDKFRCSHCGGKLVSFRHHPDTRPKGNGYARASRGE